MRSSVHNPARDGAVTCCRRRFRSYGPYNVANLGYNGFRYPHIRECARGGSQIGYAMFSYSGIRCPASHSPEEM
jgi:hypothetical protein